MRAVGRSSTAFHQPLAARYFDTSLTSLPPPLLTFISFPIHAVNIAKQAMKGYDDARAAIGAAVLLSCYHQSAAASSPSQKEAVEAVTHKVANAIDVAMQLDRKAVNAGMMVELHEAMVRAPAPVGKTLARRRGLAHLERLKDLCSPGGNISPGQSSRLLCLLSTLRSRNYLEVNNWEITNLCANVQRGCGELSVEEMQEVAAAVGHLPVAKYPRTALLLRSIAEEAVRRSAAIAGDCRAVLRAATAAAALHDSRAAALQLRKEILALQKQQLVEATAAVDVCGSEYLAALAFCCAMVVLGTAWCGGGGSSAGGGGGDVI